jgi:hypothetical protein
VSGGHQKYFWKMQQSKLDKIRRDSAEYACLSLMAKIMTNNAGIMAWQRQGRLAVMMAWKDQKCNNEEKQ